MPNAECRMLKRIRYLIPDTRYPIPDTRYPIPDTRYLIPDTSHQSPVTSHQSPVTSHRPGTNVVFERLGGCFMANSEERYEPVSCDYHDELEAAAMHKKQVELEFDLEGV